MRFDENEDIVYVPKVRKPTVERLMEEGFTIDAVVTLRDSVELDVPIEFYCLKRKHTVKCPRCGRDDCDYSYGDKGERLIDCRNCGTVEEDSK